MAVISFRLRALFVLLILSVAVSHAAPMSASATPAGGTADTCNHIRFIGEITKKYVNKKPVQDTLPQINLLKDHCWDVVIAGTDGSVKRLYTSRADTLLLDGVRAMRLKSRWRFEKKLCPYDGALVYRYNGSLRFSQNGRVISETGVFSDKKDSKRATEKEHELLPVFIYDTLQEFELVFMPYAGLGLPEMTIASKASVAADLVNEAASVKSDFSIGFFYLAFGVVFFALFLFHRKAKENLYFSLFCICVAGNCLLSYLFNDSSDRISLLFVCLVLETLAIFFAKIIKDTERSKIPVLLILALNCFFIFTPEDVFMQGATGFVHLIQGKSTASNYLSGLLFIVLNTGFIIYSGFSILFYLIQGFWQKRWEARIIVYISSIATIFAIIVPIVIVIAVFQNPEQKYINFINNVRSFGFCLYPFAAAVVLGRRNKENEQQLIRQIESIRQLNEQEREREREKQEFLEKQKTVLEQTVMERTREVTLQKEEIETINRSITDNLNYARRIQSALLPDLAPIRNELNGLALVYYPKDIVSGDFYFCDVKDDCLVIAAGDCTGHGVSGAFMSMIGSSLLKQLLDGQTNPDPAVILKELNTLVIDTFRQQQSETNDGMDIALCVVDRRKKEMRFAGANRPLWLIREGSLLTFDPDKAPIGGLQMARDRSFHNSTIPLMSGDTVYIFTDGYADQFGGERGKKMMTGKFKEVLLDIRNEDLAVQEEKLKSHFNEWKRGFDQVDDVLVIGFRI